MAFLYNLTIYIYVGLIFLISPFKSKGRLWILGRRKLFSRLQSAINANPGKIIWVHCASLGEFEQGRPLIEAIKQKYPHYKILLTFFSSSGFEIRKNYSLADYIFYLPADTKRNAKKFLAIVNPVMVYFIKYEFWYNYLVLIKQRNIPLYLISGIFRPKQIFFSWYGGWYKKILYCFSHFFVQDNVSCELLKSVGCQNYTLAGDTRFDRVYAVVNQAKIIPEAESFKQQVITLVAGSTWEPDEKYLARFFNENPTRNIKLIIAPHEIDSLHIQKLIKLFNEKVILFSEFKQSFTDNCRILIIDNIGMLSSLYRYGEIAYIGGGFGAGIHNTLEAIAYGIPVIFGPRYQKFKEAKDLILKNAGYSFTTFDQFDKIVNHLISDNQFRQQAGNSARKYLLENIGATKLILQKTISN